MCGRSTEKLHSSLNTLLTFPCRRLISGFLLLYHNKPSYYLARQFYLYQNLSRVLTWSYRLSNLHKAIGCIVYLFLFLFYVPAGFRPENRRTQQETTSRTPRDNGSIFFFLNVSGHVLP